MSQTSTREARPNAASTGIVERRHVGSDSLNLNLDAASPALLTALDRCLQLLEISPELEPVENRDRAATHAIDSDRRGVLSRRIVAAAVLVATVLAMTYAVVSLLSAHPPF